MAVYRSSRFVVMASVACGALLAISGCSSSSTEAAGTDIDSLCAQTAAEAMTLEDASALAESNGYQARVVMLDGEPQPATKDLREDRMSFDVENGVVTKCVVG